MGEHNREGSRREEYDRAEALLSDVISQEEYTAVWDHVASAIRAKYEEDEIRNRMVDSIPSWGQLVTHVASSVSTGDSSDYVREILLDLCEDCYKTGDTYLQLFASKVRKLIAH